LVAGVEGAGFEPSTFRLWAWRMWRIVWTRLNNNQI